MQTVLLADLPSPPADKTGWPWTEEPSALPAVMPDGRSWPRITVVTPSYNQGTFIEETIRSILLQGYPNLEYILIDGGSTDSTIEIINRYEPFLSSWVSEPDRGQAHAINKGLARSTGDIFNWINSDDMLTPGALAAVARAFGARDLVAGRLIFFSDQGQQKPRACRGLTPMNLLAMQNAIFFQPATWLRRQAVHDCGGIDEFLHYVFDYYLVIRYLTLFPRVAYVPDVLARFRLHTNSKTCALPLAFEEELCQQTARIGQDSRFSRLHAACEVGLRKLQWSRRLRQLASDRSLPRWQRATRILCEACGDPRIRTRMTLEAAGSISRSIVTRLFS